MKKVKFILGVFLITTFVSICLPSKTIALSNDSTNKANKTVSNFEVPDEKVNIYREYNCDPKMLIPGNPNIDPKMLINGNPNIDPKILVDGYSNIEYKMLIPSNPNLDPTYPAKSVINRTGK